MLGLRTSVQLYLPSTSLIPAQDQRRPPPPQRQGQGRGHRVAQSRGRPPPGNARRAAPGLELGRPHPRRRWGSLRRGYRHAENAGRHRLPFRRSAQARCRCRVSSEHGRRESDGEVRAEGDGADCQREV